MNRPWVWNLALLVALAVVIARFPSALSTPRLTLPPVPSPPIREPLVFPSPPPSPAAEALQEIVSRNLFNASRGRAELPTATTATPAPPPPAALKVTLFGVVIEEEGTRYAYLEGPSGGGSGRPKKYREGDSFAGAKVKSIRPDSVVLETGSGEQTVNLRAPKEGIPSVVRASPPVNRPSPNISPMPGPSGRVPGMPAPRPARRLRRPDTGNRGSGPAPTRKRARPVFRDANPDGSSGEIDGEEGYYQDGYPGSGDAPDYHEEEEYESEAPW